MGGNSASTPQTLQGLFGQNPGYQQQPVAPIGAPAAQMAIQPTPEQAAAATMARMQARNPMAAPVAAPKKQTYTVRGGEGDSHGRGSGGAW